MLSGSPSLQLGSYDWQKWLKVAAYLGGSAFLTSLAQSMLDADFSAINVDLGIAKLNGEQIAMAAANLLAYLVERFLKDTSK